MNDAVAPIPATVTNAVKAPMTSTTVTNADPMNDAVVPISAPIPALFRI